jgi:hypothetical protein
MKTSRHRVAARPLLTICRIILLTLLLPLPGLLRADISVPVKDSGEWLDSWSFSDTNTCAERFSHDGLSSMD